MLTVRRPSSTTHWDLPMRCPASAVLTAMLTAASSLATGAERALALQDRRRSEHQQSGRHPVVGGRGGRSGLFRLPRLASVCTRCGERHAALGLLDRQFLGDQLPCGPRRQGLLRHQRLGTRAGTRCASERCSLHPWSRATLFTSAAGTGSCTRSAEADLARASHDAASQLAGGRGLHIPPRKDHAECGSLAA